MVKTFYGSDLVHRHNNEIKNVVKNLKYIFEFQWLNYIKRKDDHNKLRTYNKFKHTFEMEPYLSWSVDYKIRINMTKLRTSTHSLEIEMGRFKFKDGKSIHVNERICKFCNLNVVEDEKHVIMSCKNYDVSRIKMFEDISDIFPDFTLKDIEEKFIFIMSVKDIELYNITTRYLNDVAKKRGRL